MPKSCFCYGNYIDHGYGQVHSYGSGKNHGQDIKLFKLHIKNVKPEARNIKSKLQLGFMTFKQIENFGRR